jgi:hypothetical protein
MSAFGTSEGTVPRVSDVQLNFEIGTTIIVRNRARLNQRAHWIMLSTFDVAENEQRQPALRSVIFLEPCWKTFVRVVKSSRHDL